MAQKAERFYTKETLKAEIEAIGQRIIAKADQIVSDFDESRIESITLCCKIEPSSLARIIVDKTYLYE